MMISSLITQSRTMVQFIGLEINPPHRKLSEETGLEIMRHNSVELHMNKTSF